LRPRHFVNDGSGLLLSSWGRTYFGSGISMTFVDALKVAVSVASVFSWIALLIALVPTLFVTFAIVDTRRWHYAIAGLLGGLGGGFCGAASLFLSLWFSCRGHVQGCNTAQGDMGLLVTFPLGSLAGCLVGLLFMNLYSVHHPFRSWAYWISSQLAIWAATTMLFGRLMA